jgi:hypothetical protein
MARFDNKSGDPLFDLWTLSKEPGGEVSVSLTAKGKSCVGALHGSWISLVDLGGNLLLEYPTVEEWCLNDLFDRLKKSKHRVILLELRPTLSEITYRENKLDTKEIKFPIGFAVSSYKISRNLPTVPKNFTRIPIEIPTGLPTDDLVEKCYKSVLKTGIV